LVAIGFAAGTVFTIHTGIERLRQSIANPAAHPAAQSLAERALVRIQKNLTQELKLTPEESARLQAILDQSSKNLKAIRRQGVQEGREEITRAIREIAESLPPEKRTDFRRHVTKRMIWLTPKRDTAP
jgi:hypothetical protein